MNPVALFNTPDWELSALDAGEMLDRVSPLDEEFASIYRKTMDFASILLDPGASSIVEEAFMAYANLVGEGRLEGKDDLETTLWAGYHPLPLLFARLRWYGEDATYHYTDGDRPGQSKALKTELDLARGFHEWLPGNWLPVSETGAKGFCGEVLQRAEARYALDTDQDLTVDQVVVLSGLTRRSVLNAVSKTGEAGLEVGADGKVSNFEARRWLGDRRNFQPTKGYRLAEENEPTGKASAEEREAVAYEFVPVTDDGTAFLPDLRRVQGYQIGKYGHEEYVADYFEALSKLQAMGTPRFRRPNAEGNWGIKVGVDWRRVPLDELRRAADETGDA